MSDERLRDLERRALASNDPSDRARIALERLRLGATFDQLPVEEGAALLLDRASRGELDEDRLRLAAYAGSPHARAALGGSAPGEQVELGFWCSGLVAWTGAPRRAALAVARAAVVVLAEVPHMERVIDRLTAAIALVEERLDEDPDRVLDDLWTFDRGLDSDELELIGGPPLRAISRLVVLAAGDGGVSAHHELLDGGRVMFTDLELRAIAGPALVEWALRPPVADRYYSPRERFRVADVVVHPKFGRGVVQTANARQVEIAFDDGVVRKLAHGL